MKRQSKRPASSHESTETGDNPAFGDQDEALAAPARNMEHGDGAELDDMDDDDDDLAGGRAAARSACGLGEKKRRLALDQVRALERCFETDNKLDPERKSRIARDLGLQPRQVAVWFQNRRARWKTKALERDFAALRARHDALRSDCDALRRDKDALAAEIRELRQKLSRPEAAAAAAAVKLEAASNDAAAGAAAVCKQDGSTDSDSSVVFNDVEASPYSGAAFEQPAFGGFGASFLDTSAAAAAVKLEAASNDAAAGAAAVCKQDGSSDSDSSVVFNDVEASPYSGAAFEQPAFGGFGASFLDTSAAAAAAGCCTSLPMLETKWPQGPIYPCDSSFKTGGGYGFTEEWLASSDVIGNDGAASFFSDEHASSLNFGWCASGADGWE